jgi:hypothetical protein
VTAQNQHSLDHLSDFSKSTFHTFGVSIAAYLNGLQLASVVHQLSSSRTENMTDTAGKKTFKHWSAIRRRRMRKLVEEFKRIVSDAYWTSCRDNFSTQLDVLEGTLTYLKEAIPVLP